MGSLENCSSTLPGTEKTGAFAKGVAAAWVKRDCEASGSGSSSGAGVRPPMGNQEHELDILGCWEAQALKR